MPNPGDQHDVSELKREAYRQVDRAFELGEALGIHGLVTLEVHHDTGKAKKVKLRIPPPQLVR